jgi:hypothetical protein
VLTSCRSVARKHYWNWPKKHIFKQAGKLTSLSDRKYAFAKISCQSCYLNPNFQISGVGFHVENLSEDCDFCGILRTCQQHFANDCKFMTYQFRRGENDIQICFRDDLSKDHCKDIHIQLYSKGLSSTSVHDQ